MIFSTDETELTEKKVDHLGNKTKLCTITVALGWMQWTQAMAGGGGRRNKHFWKLSKNMYKL